MDIKSLVNAYLEEKFENDSSKKLDEDAWKEAPMMKRQLHFVSYAAEEIIDYVDMGVDPEEWFQNKLAHVHGQMRTLHAYVEGDKRMMTNMYGEETELTEKSVSRAQQMAAGAALAAKRGELKVSELEGASKEMYDSMSEKDLEDFASTKHKGLPQKIDEIKSNGWIVVNVDTNEPTKSMSGKALIYADEKSANAALLKMPKNKQKGYMVEPNFDVYESTELKENKNLLKDYKDMKSQGKKDNNILDVLMSMPKYKKMSRDQMSKVIGDAKRKGIFKEEVELTEDVHNDLNDMIIDFQRKLMRINKSNLDPDVAKEVKNIDGDLDDLRTGKLFKVRPGR